MGENRGSQNNTDTVWQKCIPQLFTIFNKQESLVFKLWKFILNNMISCWQHMVTKLVKSLCWWPPFPKGFLRGTEFIHWATQTQLGQGKSMKCKGRSMLQWGYQSCTHCHGWHCTKAREGGWGFSRVQEGRREKPTRSASVLADGKIPISNQAWTCWAAAVLLRKAHPCPKWWGRNP